MFSILFSVMTAFALNVPQKFAGVNLVDGKSIEVSVDPAKTYAVVFLSTKCPCSNSHLTELKNLVTDYPAVTVIGVHSNLDEKNSGAYFSSHGFNFPVIEDHENTYANELGAFKTPHSYVINGGAVVYRGGVSDHQTYEPDGRKYLREALEDVKQNRPVKNATTRILGCAIPRS